MKNIGLNHVIKLIPKEKKQVIVCSYDKTKILLAHITYILNIENQYVPRWYGFQLLPLEENEDTGWGYNLLDKFPFWMEIPDAIKCFSRLKKNIQHNKEIVNRSILIDI